VRRKRTNQVEDTANNPNNPTEVGDDPMIDIDKGIHILKLDSSKYYLMRN